MRACVHACVRMSVCVCVCVRARARARACAPVCLSEVGPSEHGSFSDVGPF